MTTFKGNLSKKLKNINPKLTHNTLEKSEIARIFEKMKQKRDKIAPSEKKNEGTNENEILGIKCNRSMKFENSPKLKPKNRSKFEEIRSFSEGHIDENTQRGTGTNSGNPKVKFLNIVDDIKYPSIASKIQKVDGGNIAIMSAENINNPAIISLKKIADRIFDRTAVSTRQCLES